MRAVLLLLLAASVASVVRSASYALDVVVYGATPGGIMAACAAARANSALRVGLVHATGRIGGMSAGGLGHTDIGNASVVGGLARTFFNLVGAKYGTSEPVYNFEPSVALAVFQEMLATYKVSLYLNEPLASVSKSGATVQSLTTTTGDVFSASVFLDGSYNGDLIAAAGVSTTYGRESQAQYGESFAGVVKPYTIGDHQFYTPINHTFANGTFYPFIQTNASALPPWGSGDAKVQAYNFRLCLTTNSSNRLPIPAPQNYDPARWSLARAYMEQAVNHTTASLGNFMNISPLPNEKTDVNNNGPISTDVIGASWGWPTGDAAARQAIYDAHVQYTLEFLYFLANDASVPAQVQSQMRAYGLAADEFTENGGFPTELYVREAYRMVSDYVFTQADRMVNRLKNDSVGLGSYNIDTHNAERYANATWVLNEGDVEQGSGNGPFQMPYAMLVPRAAEATNLLAPVPCSASHIGFGAIRLEPQWMILGESAGVAAVQALKEQVPVQNISIPTLQATLLSVGQILSF